MYLYTVFFFFCKQKTAYEMRISDWSSDVCSSDLRDCVFGPGGLAEAGANAGKLLIDLSTIDPRASRDMAARAGLRWVDSPVSGRSEARRVGKEGVSTCRSRWSPYH